MLSVTLVPIDFDQQPLLLGLRSILEQTFHCPIRVQPAWFEVESALDPARAQYNSSTLLGRLLDPPPPGEDRVLGVTTVDLFIPILTYVFGEAQLDGQAAVVSTYRLHNEPYGMESREGLLLERLAKEAIHELGHAFGLPHCRHPRCVMRSATYVEQIDLKESEFCLPCQEHLSERPKR